MSHTHTPVACVAMAAVAVLRVAVAVVMGVVVAVTVAMGLSGGMVVPTLAAVLVLVAVLMGAADNNRNIQASLLNRGHGALRGHGHACTCCSAHGGRGRTGVKRSRPPRESKNRSRN
eukprot:960099-Pelagomonas_calceolata.AAC.4